MSTENMHTLWEKSYISSKNLLNVNEHKFNYQLILKGVEHQNSQGQKRYSSISRVKVFPLCVYFNSTNFTFVANPFNKVSQCSMGNTIIPVKWEEGFLKNPVLTIEELNPNEQLNKHLVMLERYIEEEMIPNIHSKFQSAGIIPME